MTMMKAKSLQACPLSACLQIQELREQVVQANQLRRQQLVELGLLREEEKQKMQHDHEDEVLHVPV